jgi:hypothetical protein
MDSWFIHADARDKGEVNRRKHTVLLLTHVSLGHELVKDIGG